jgi:hypothetical protein
MDLNPSVAGFAFVAMISISHVVVLNLSVFKSTGTGLRVFRQAPP